MLGGLINFIVMGAGAQHVQDDKMGEENAFHMFWFKHLSSYLFCKPFAAETSIVPSLFAHALDPGLRIFTVHFLFGDSEKHGSLHFSQSVDQFSMAPFQREAAVLEDSRQVREGWASWQ